MSFFLTTIGAAAAAASVIEGAVRMYKRVMISDMRLYRLINSIRCNDAPAINNLFSYCRCAYSWKFEAVFGFRLWLFYNIGRTDC